MGLVDSKSRSTILKYIYKKIFTIPTIKHAKFCIAVTAEEKLDLIKCGALNENISIIPNGIVPNDFLSADNLGFRNKFGLGDKKIMLFIGRMDPIKGVELLIDAFTESIENFEDWILVLVGTNTRYRKKMEKKVHNLNLTEKIFF